MCLKKWAKELDICDAFEGTCNSYCWVNIGIWCLKNLFGKNFKRIKGKFGGQ